MYQRILVPFDASPTSNRGLDEAIQVAKLTHGRIRLLHSIDEFLFSTGFESGAAFSADIIPMMKKAGEEVLQQGKERAEAQGIAAETVLLEGMAARLCDQVARAASDWGADLIVIGTHGRRGVRRMFLGSDAEQILRLAPVPVLLVRDRDAESRSD